MTYFTSRAQDAAQRIKECQIAVEAANRSYCKGGSLDALNKANAALAAAHNDLYEIDGGVIPDRR
jgi:hypothetical protein